MKLIHTIAAAAILAAGIINTAHAAKPAPAAKSAAYDIMKPENAGSAFVRLRGDTNGSDVIADWHTTVFIVEPGKRAMPIMRLDGFNVGRAIKKDDGTYQWLSREVAYYRDLKTGNILDKWENPLTGQTNDVLQVVNDPVNGTFGGPRPMPWRVKGEDVFLSVDVPLSYPNALLPADFPEESTGPTYFATESFMFFAKLKDFANPKLTSVPSSYAWARTGPWLPWMKMGTRPGYVLYTGQGKKLKNASELDPVVREYTEKNYPDFMFAPKTFVAPNETSWTYYRKKSGKKISAPIVSGKDAPAAEAAKK
jgi:hypothetical protein